MNSSNKNVRIYIIKKKIVQILSFLPKYGSIIMVFGTSVIENMKVALTLLIEELSKEFELYLGVDDEAILSI